MTVAARVMLAFNKGITANVYKEQEYMSRMPHKENKFSEKWKRAGAETQRKIAGKPIARILWENAVRKDDSYKADSDHFDSQTAFTAWLQGWTESEIENQCRPNGKPHSGLFAAKKEPRTQQEIEELRATISKTVELSPAAEDMQLYRQVHDDKHFVYACNVGDVLDWVLGKISTEDFLSGDYVDLENLRRIMKR